MFQKLGRLTISANDLRIRLKGGGKGGQESSGANPNNKEKQIPMEKGEKSNFGLFLSVNQFP